MHKMRSASISLGERPKCRGMRPLMYGMSGLGFDAFSLVGLQVDSYTSIVEADREHPFLVYLLSEPPPDSMDIFLGIGQPQTRSKKKRRRRGGRTKERVGRGMQDGKRKGETRPPQLYLVPSIFSIYLDISSVQVSPDGM